MPLSFKMMGFGLLLMLVGFMLRQQELRLTLFGKRTTAKLYDSGAWVNKETGQIQSVEVQFQFKDDKGDDIVSTIKGGPSFRPPANGEFDIVYLSGNSRVNRPYGKPNYSGYIIFAVGTLLTIGGFIYFNQESVTEAHAETMRDLANPPKSRAQRGIERIIGE